MEGFSFTALAIAYAGAALFVGLVAFLVSEKAKRARNARITLIATIALGVLLLFGHVAYVISHLTN